MGVLQKYVPVVRVRVLECCHQTLAINTPQDERYQSKFLCTHGILQLEARGWRLETGLDRTMKLNLTCAMVLSAQNPYSSFGVDHMWWETMI